MQVRERDDPEASAGGRVAFMKEAKASRHDNAAPQHPICTLAITLPDYDAQVHSALPFTCLTHPLSLTALSLTVLSLTCRRLP